MKVLDWREMRKGSLLGFAKIELPSGMVLNDCTVLMGNNGPWASPPSKPMISKDGIAMKDAEGKQKYVPIVEFASKEVRERWSAGVVEAVRQAHPEVFS